MEGSERQEWGMEGWSDGGKRKEEERGRESWSMDGVEGKKNRIHCIT